MQMWIKFYLLLATAIASVCGQPYCPPAEEGKPYPLRYIGPLLKEYRYIYWQAINIDGDDEVEVATCMDENCHNSSEGFSLSIHRENTSLSTELIISTIKPSHRNIMWNLTAAESMHKNNTVQLFSCVTNAYLAPENTTCQLQLVSRTRVQMSCRAEKVFPGVLCLLYQENDAEQPTNVTTTTVQYDHVSILQNEPEYYNVECSATVYPSISGRYKYTVNLFYDLPGHTSFGSPFLNFSEEVIIFASPSVTIEYSPDMRICPNQTNMVTMICTAHNFPSAPHFHWSTGGPVIDVPDNGDSDSGHAIGTESSTYISTWSFHAPFDSLLEIKVTCEAGTTADGASPPMTAQGSELVKPKLPQWNHPRFVDENGLDLEQLVEISVGTGLTVVCHVEEEAIDVTEISVECWQNSVEEMLIVSNKNTSLSIFVNDTFAFNNVVCICAVLYHATCPPLSTNLSFILMPAKSSFLSVIKISATEKEILEYIFLGTLVLSACIAMLVAVVKCLRHKNNGDSYRPVETAEEELNLSSRIS